MAGGLRGFACFACTPFIFSNISFISFTLHKRTCTLHTHTHTCTHTHVFCQHFREMGSHENWERETEIKIGVWQAKEKTLPDPPPPPPSSPPLHIAAGRVARPIAAPTCTEEGKRAKEREDSGGSGNAANIFGATARTRSSSGCHCHRLRCQRQRRRCYFVSVVSTVDTKSKKHFTTMSILNMATLHCTHIHTSTHARTRTSHPRAALQTMRRRKCE